MSFQYTPISVLDAADDYTLPAYVGLLLVRCNTAYGSFTLTFPSPTNAGLWVIQKNTSDAYTVSFTLPSGITCDGESSLGALTKIGDGYLVWSDGSLYHTYHPRLVVA